MPVDAGVSLSKPLFEQHVLMQRRQPPAVLIAQPWKRTHLSSNSLMGRVKSRGCKRKEIRLSETDLMMQLVVASKVCLNLIGGAELEIETSHSGIV